MKTNMKKVLSGVLALLVFVALVAVAPVSRIVYSIYDANRTNEILAQLEACRMGQISSEELEAAKQAMYSSLRGIHDSPGSIEGFYGSAALSGMALTPEAYRRAVEETTVTDVAEAAKTLKPHTVYFLKGVR